MGALTAGRHGARKKAIEHRASQPAAEEKRREIRPKERKIKRSDVEAIHSLHHKEASLFPSNNSIPTHKNAPHSQATAPDT
jgi:hypothetical protein